ncbi:MAG: hypothetical protein FJ098_15760 [Deltaproteobacteria bacterium]|nr:hypothetical protein [Deltaproteobacteria bacterium]
MHPEDSRPKHKILCQRKYYRYVVACMHNCQEPHFCREFWTFFKAKGLTPREYHNDGGIGEAVMRRVVFDCDRCGKKDLDEVFGLYDRGGEGPEHLLGEEARMEQVAEVGYRDPLVVTLSQGVFSGLAEGRGWLHYCRRCFAATAEGLAKIANVKPVARTQPRTKNAAATPGPAARPATPAAPPAPRAPAPRAPEPPPPAASPREETPARPAKGRPKKSSGEALPLAGVSRR